MEQGEKTADLCCEAGVSRGIMYQWKSKYSGMEVSQLKKLKVMESGLSQYEKIVAELTLQKTVLKHVIEKSYKACRDESWWITAVKSTALVYGRPVLFSLHFSVYYYKPKPYEDHVVRDALSSLAEQHAR